MAEIKTNIYELIKPGVEHGEGSLSELLAGRALTLISLLEQGYNLDNTGHYMNNSRDSTPAAHPILERFDDLIFLRDKQLREENAKYGVREPETIDAMARTTQRIEELRKNVPTEASPGAPKDGHRTGSIPIYYDAHTGRVLTKDEAEQTLQNA